MAKPDPIRRLEKELGLELTDLADRPDQQKIIARQALLAAWNRYYDAHPDAPEPPPGDTVQAGAELLQEAALARMRMSVCRNCYLADAGGRLIALNLCDDGLVGFPFDRAEGWAALRVLSLAGNRLAHAHLGEGLRALQWLDLSDNPELRVLRFSAPLPALETLDASDSGLEQIEFPAGFSGLKTLDLSRNKLESAVFKGDCPALEWLDLSGNKLSAFRLPNGFEDLAYLYLNDNALETLVLEAPLPQLNTLHLRNNRLGDLPGKLYLSNKLEALYLHNNPLPRLPKGKSGVPEGERENAAVPVRNYLRSLAEDEPAPMDEVKLVLLGNSTAGKSTLVRFLMEGKYDDESLGSTEGISNRIWEPRELGFKVNIWDFGGQEFYHATHRLFLSENALSLVLFASATNRQGEQLLPVRIYENDRLTLKTLPVETFHFSYWLENIRFFCAGKQTIQLVQSKMDEGHPEEVSTNIKRSFRLPDDTPRISVLAASKGDRPYSGKFEAFRADLFAALEQAKGKYPFSKKWLLIKNELRREAEKRPVPVMTHGEYVAFCEKLRPNIHAKTGAEQYSMLDSLTDYLHETGVILYYRKIEMLKDKVFIRPDWVTDAIYKVLNYEVLHNNGLFHRDQAARALPDADPDDILRIMEQFEIIFPAKNKPGWYVAPQYLSDRNPLEAPEHYLYEKLVAQCSHMSFVLRFPHFLPRSVITRFLCKYGPLATETYWKNGILFEKNDVWVRVERENILDIVVRTDREHSGLDHAFFEDFCRILSDAPESRDGTAALNPDSINPEILISPDGRRFVSVQKLLKHPGKAQSEEIEAADGKNMKIDLFGRLFLPADAKTSEPPKPKVFISYAHADGADFMQGMKTHLGALIKLGKIEPWDDRMISAGEWSPQIQAALDAADIFILLVTPEFITSRYIQTVELKTAGQKYAAGKARIFPVLCDFCDWKDLPLPLGPADKRLGAFEVFPQKGKKPVAKWRNRNEAFLEVIESLKKELP